MQTGAHTLSHVSFLSANHVENKNGRSISVRNFHEHTKKVVKYLADMPIMFEVTSQLIRFLSSVSTIENYDYKNPIIKNGDCETNFDYLFISKGKVEFHLCEQVRVPGKGLGVSQYSQHSSLTALHPTTLIHKCNANDFVDVSFLKAKRLKKR